MEVRFEVARPIPSDGPLPRQAPLSKGPASLLSRHSNILGDVVQGDRGLDASGDRKSKVMVDILRVACRTASDAAFTRLAGDLPCRFSDHEGNDPHPRRRGFRNG